MYNILVVDDDKEIVKAIEIYLGKENYNIFKAYDGEQALKVIDKNEIHLAILDVMMPNKDGLETLEEIRKNRNIPVIILSAKSEDIDKINGLNIGADDYVTKPFHNEELLARIKVHLKHHFSNPDEVLKIGDIELNPKTYQVICNGLDITLSKIEFEILKLLMKNNNQVVTKSVLFDTVWDTMDSADENTLNVHISKIRNKLKKANPNKDYIETIWSVGYKFKN